MTEHFYNIEFEGLCLNERDLKKLLEVLAVSADADIDMKTVSNPEIFKKYQNSKSQLTHALNVLETLKKGLFDMGLCLPDADLKALSVLNILKDIDISKISYDGSGTFLGGQ